MNRGLLALIACSALVLAVGCGSSNSSNSASSASSSAGASASSTATRTGGLTKNTTTPKYASPPASAPVQSGTVQIAYRNIAIDPDTAKVKVGSTIKWTNYDQTDHNVTSQGAGPAKFASKDFGEGATFEFKATKAGVIHYMCTIHPASMNGTIEVVQ
jgi:plastocyanin